MPYGPRVLVCFFYSVTSIIGALLAYGIVRLGGAGSPTSRAQEASTIQALPFLSGGIVINPALV